MAGGVFKAEFDARRVAVDQDAARFVVVDRVAGAVVPAPATFLLGNEVLGAEGVQGGAAAGAGVAGAFIQAGGAVDGQYAAQGVQG